jgi:hypothetical protein
MLPVQVPRTPSRRVPGWLTDPDRTRHAQGRPAGLGPNITSATLTARTLDFTVTGGPTLPAVIAKTIQTSWDVTCQVVAGRGERARTLRGLGGWSQPRDPIISSMSSAAVR